MVAPPCPNGANCFAKPGLLEIIDGILNAAKIMKAANTKPTIDKNLAHFVIS
ncbi:hypothetical protein D3C73_1353680 [compost metagenome]